MGLNAIISINGNQHNVMLSVVFYYYAEYAECLYTECRCAKNTCERHTLQLICQERQWRRKKIYKVDTRLLESQTSWWTEPERVKKICKDSGSGPDSSSCSGSNCSAVCLWLCLFLFLFLVLVLVLVVVLVLAVVLAVILSMFILLDYSYLRRASLFCVIFTKLLTNFLRPGYLIAKVMRTCLLSYS